MDFEHTSPHCSVPPSPLLKTSSFFPPVSLLSCLCCWSCSGLGYRLLCAGCCCTAAVCSGFHQLQHSQQFHSPVLQFMTPRVSFPMMLPGPWEGDVDVLLSAEGLTHISHLFLVLRPVVSLWTNYDLLQKEPYLSKTESITH